MTTLEYITNLLAERDELRAALAELEPIADRMGGAAPVYDLLHAATQKARAALAKTKGAK